MKNYWGLLPCSDPLRLMRFVGEGEGDRSLTPREIEVGRLPDWDGSSVCRGLV